VSRCHAIIKYNKEEGLFSLEDNLSKFGTLVLAKDPVPLSKDTTMALQIGRSVVSFTVKDSMVPVSPKKASAMMTRQPANNDSSS